MHQTGNKPIIAVAALIFALAAQSTVHAQGNPPAAAGAGLPLVLNITGTAKIQNPNSGQSNDNGTKTTTAYKLEGSKVSTTDIISLIATNEGVTFSKTAKLVYVGGAVEVEDGTNILDASAEITISLDPNGDGVWNGTDTMDDNTGADTQKFTGTYLATLVFADASGNNFTLNGLATETFTDGIDQNGDATRGTDSISMTLSGDGTIGGINAAISGKIKASGSGIPE